MNTIIVPDYNEWVREEDEMWLNKIQERIRMGEYRVYRQMLADVQQIHTNALAYNAAEHGRSSGGEGEPSCGYPTGGTSVHALRELRVLTALCIALGMVAR